MYNITISGTETLVGTAVTVSISETDDSMVTHPLTGFRTFCADQFDGLEPGSLESFLEQVITAAVNTLSANRDRLAEM